jgi:hypothetical protein
MEHVLVVAPGLDLGETPRWKITAYDLGELAPSARSPTSRRDHVRLDEVVDGEPVSTSHERGEAVAGNDGDDADGPRLRSPDR